jgi:hypothetical protein
MVLMIGIVCMASPVFSAFFAADLIYIPVVAHIEGLNDSFWRSDLYITNVDEVPIDVMMVFLPSGLQNNAGFFQDRSLWLGGREEDGFGFIDVRLADIPPNATVILRDVVAEHWLEQLGTTGLGGMIVFAYEADTLEDDGTRVFRDAVVMTRTYTDATLYEPDPENEGEFLEVNGTFGQGVPGVPWYNMADPAAVSEDGDFSFYVLVGGTETADFRYNVGILNGSDVQTLISLAIQPFQPNGDPFLDEQDEEVVTVVTLPSLGHIQYTQILSAQFGLSDVEGILIKVSFIGWQSTSTDPKPAMISYGSVGDNRFNDATTVLGSFAFPYDVDCVWPNAKSRQGADGAPRHTVTERPLQAPALR